MADVNKNGIVASESSESCTSKKRKDLLKVEFINEETQKLIDSWSKGPVLFQCSHKDCLKKDAKLSAIHRILETLDKPGKQRGILFIYFLI